MTDTVIQGVAELTIAPFLASLQQLNATVKSTVAAINAQLATLGAPLAAAMGNFGTVSEGASAKAATAQEAASARATAAVTKSEASMTTTVEREAAAQNVAAKKSWDSRLAASTTAQSAMTKAEASMSATVEKEAVAQNVSAKKSFDAQLTGFTQTQAAAQKTAATAKAAATETAQGISIFGSSAVAKASDNLKGIEDRLNSIYRAGAQVSQVGMNIAILGGVITGLAGVSVMAAAAFDGWTRKFLAASQAAGSVALDLGQVEAMFQQVSESTGVSGDKVAEAAARFEQAFGIQIRSMQDVSGIARIMEVTMQAVSVTNEDVTTSIVGITQILGGFGMGINDAVNVTMALSNASQVTNGTFGDFIEAMKMVSSVAKGLGMDVYETTAVLGELSNVGQKGTMAGRGLQRFLQGLIDPSKQADAALQEILVTNQDLNGSWRDIVFPAGNFLGLIDKMNADGTTQVGVIGKIYEATKNLTEADREQFISTVTTANAYRVISPLIALYGKQLQQAQQDGADGAQATAMTMVQLDAALRDVTTRTKIFSDQWETVSQGMQVSWAQELATAMGLIRNVGTAANAALLPIVHDINIIIVAIEEWRDNNIGLFNGVVSGTVILGGLLLVLGALGIVLGQSLSAFSSFTVIIKGFFSILTILGAVFSPISLALLGIVAALVILSNAWKNNWAGMTSFLDGIVATMKAVLMGIIEIIGDIVTIITDLFNGKWGDAWSAFVDILITALAIADLVIQNTIAKAGLWGANFVINLADGMAQAANTILAAVLTGIGNMIGSFFKGNSPPKEGPLKDIEVWAENLVDAYGKGMEKGAQKKLKPAAENVAKVVSKPLEGHSPAKEGPLSEIGTWGTNLMNALLKGFTQADFSVITDAVGTATTYLKKQLDAKKIDVASFLGDIGDVRSIMVGVMDAIRKGGDVAANAFEKVKSIVGSIGDDIENIVRAYAEVVTAQKTVDDLTAQKTAIEAQQTENYDKPKKALEDQNKELELLKYGWEQQKAAIEDAATALDKQKVPLQDQQYAIGLTIRGYQDELDKINDATLGLEKQKSALEAQKVPLEDIISGIQDEIDKLNQSHQAIQDSLSVLSDEKTAIDDQIKAIESQYDIQREAAKSALSDMQDQLDLVKEINVEKLKAPQAAVDAADTALSALQKQDQKAIDALQNQLDLVKEINVEKMAPLQAAVDTTGAALSEKQKQDKQEEVVLQRQIADYQSKGVAPYYIDQLNAQLQTLQNAHQDDEGALQDQKDAAQATLDTAKNVAQLQEDALSKQITDQQKTQDAAESLLQDQKDAATFVLDAAKAAVQTQEDALSKQITDQQRAQTQIEKSQNTSIAQQEVGLNKRLAAIDSETKNLTLQAKVIDMQVAAKNAEIKAEQDKEKAIDKQAAAIDKQEANLKTQSDSIQRDIDLENRKSTRLQGEVDAIARQEELLRRTEAVADANLKKISDQQGANTHQVAVLDQNNMPTVNAIADIDKQIKAANDALKAAQDRYDIEKSIAALYDQERQDAEAAAKAAEAAAKAAGAGGVGAGGAGAGAGGVDAGGVDAPDVPGIGAELQGELEGLRQKAKDTLAGLSKDLDAEKEKIKAKVWALFNFDTPLKFSFGGTEDQETWNRLRAQIDKELSADGKLIGDHLAAWGSNVGIAMGGIGKTTGDAMGGAGKGAGDAMGGAGKAIGDSMGGMGSGIGESFAGIVTAATKAATAVGDAFGRAGKSAGDAFGNVGKTVGDALGGIGKAWDKAQAESDKFNANMKKSMDAIGVDIGKMGAFVGEGIGRWMGAWGKNVGDGMGKIGSSFGGFLGEWGKNVGDGMGKIGSSLGTFMGEWGTNIGDGMGKIGSSFGGFLGEWGTNIGDGMGKIGSSFGTFLGAWGTNIGDGMGKIGSSFGGFLGAWGTNIGDGMGKIGTDIGTFMGAWGTNIGDGMGKIGSKFGEWIGTWATNITGGTGTISTDFGTWMGSLGENFKTFWTKTLPDFITNSWANFSTAIWDLLHKIFGSGIIGDWLTSLQTAWDTFWKTTIPTIFTTAGTALTTLVTTAFNAIKDALVGTDGIVTKISSAIGNILGADDSSGLRGIWNTAFTSIQTFLGTIGTTIHNGLVGPDGIVTKISTTIQNLLGIDDASGLRGIWNTAFTGIQTLLSTIGNAIHNFLVGPDGIITKIKTAATNLLGTDGGGGLWGIFQSAWNGIISVVNTIKKPIDDVITKIGDLIGDVADLLGKLPGVQGAMDLISGAQSALDRFNSTPRAAPAPSPSNQPDQPPYGRPGIDDQGDSSIAGHAGGTDWASGGLSWVGEKGPELLNLPTGSQVIPNDSVRGLLSQMATMSSVQQSMIEAMQGLTAQPTAAPVANNTYYILDGVNIVDQRGLKWLEGELKQVRDLRTSRIAPA